MKIQKLVYLAHGHALVENNTPLIDELFEAWKFGPVLPSLYQECKKYVGDEITEYIKDYNYQTLSRLPAAIPTDEKTLKIINFVWDNYGSMDAMSLSEWTHEKDGPWDKAIRKNSAKYRNAIVDNEDIKNYFIKNMNNDEAA